MSRYTKTQTYNITRRLYNLIRKHSDRIHFKKLNKNIYGLYDHGTEEITIDYRRDIISTLVHEALHHWHNDWCETKVYRNESLIMNSLSAKQIKNILHILGENVN